MRSLNLNLSRLLALLVLLCVATPATAQQDVDARKIYLGATGCVLQTDSGSPEGAKTGNVCDSYRDTATGSTFMKTSGTGNTGWARGLFSSAAGGTIGALAKFTAAGVLGNSLFTESGSVITLTGTQTITGDNAIPLHLVRAGADSLNLRMQRTVGAAQADWYLYLPSGSTDFRLFNGGDRMSLTSAGNVTFAGTVSGTVGAFTGTNTTPLHLVQTGGGSVNWRVQRTGATPADWFGYVPSGSTDFRFFDTADRVTFVGGGGIVSAVTNSTAAIDLQQSGTSDLNMRLRRSSGTASDWFMYLPTGSTDLRFWAGGSSGADRLTMTAAGDLLPATNYVSDLGALNKKYLTLHAAELWVETLVAAETQATMGGRLIVPRGTTTLAADLSTSSTSIQVAHNNLANGHLVRMEAAGKVEWLAVTSASSGSGPYTYTVTRNLDGSGANEWFAGDALVNTGTTGDGFIDIYASGGVLAGVGPSIVGNVRTGTTYSDIAPRWAVGNLNGLYGYLDNTYGFAAGDNAGPWVKVDATSGVRIGHGGSTKIALDGSGNASFTGNVTTGGGTIGGWTITATQLFSGTGTNTVGLDSGTPGNPAFWAGASSPLSAPTRISRDGVLTTTAAVISDATLTNATVSGAFSASSGTVSLGASGIRVTPSTSSHATVNGYTFTTAAGMLGMTAIHSGTSGDSFLRLGGHETAARVDTQIVARNTSGATSTIDLSSGGGEAMAARAITLTTATFTVNALAAFPGGANAPTFTGASGGNLAVFTSTGTGATSWIHYLTTSSAYSFYNGGDRLVIGNTGSIRMPGYGAGTATFDASGNITSSSDERVKDVVGAFTPGLREILGLETKLFRYKESTGLDTRNVYAGFIAQNVLRYVPEAVGEDRAGMLSVNFVPIVAATVNAIQELTAEVDELRAQLKLPPRNRTVAPLTDKARVISSAKARTYPEKQ